MVRGVRTPTLDLTRWIGVRVDTIHPRTKTPRDTRLAPLSKDAQDDSSSQPLRTSNTTRQTLSGAEHTEQLYWKGRWCPGTNEAWPTQLFVINHVTFLMLKFSSVTWDGWTSQITHREIQHHHVPFPEKNNNESQLCFKALAFHSLHSHIIVTDPSLNGHTIYPSKVSTVPKELRSNQHFGGIFLLELLQQGL